MTEISARGAASRLQRELEEGALKTEMFGTAQAAELDAAAQPAPATYLTHLEFTGRGAEYFRIWVVNLLLSLLTLGIYSAWAKVRKARWFARHTRLMGDAFDYHGDPWRILLGRLLGLMLLLGYSYAFLWSTTAGLLMFGLLYAAGPLLFASAQRFRLGNTSWRGLRFGFDAPWQAVYKVCLPLLILWTISTLVIELDLGNAAMWTSLALTALGLPWAHARLKQLQHAHARYGDQTFSFASAQAQFYGLYAGAFGLLLLGGLLAGLIVGLVAVVAGAQWSNGAVPQVLTGLGVMLILWLVIWPYFAARTQRIVWGHTRLGDIDFIGEMQAGTLWRLALKQTLLVLLTAGLYWPFAAVALARYRVQAIALRAGSPLEGVVVTAAAASDKGAAGDGSADLFGLDLGW